VPRPRASTLAIAAFAVVMTAGLARGDEVTVPATLQVQLLGRVVRYERSFAARPTEPAHVLIVVRARSPESLRIASQITSALSQSPQLGGRNVTVGRVDFVSAAALRAEVERSHATIAYLTAGLAGEIEGIAAALSGLSVMTVSAVGGDVDHGAVLGFELASSRPQIAVNLGTASDQGLQFSAQLLRLARVVR
jgi:hypothetical protein